MSEKIDKRTSDGQEVAVEELTTQVIPIVNTPARQMVESLRPLLPATIINAEPDSNTVVITDSAANIARIIRLIRKLDNAN